MEDGGGAALVAVASLCAAVGNVIGRRGGGDMLDGAQQSGLIVLDLDDQPDAGLGRDLEVFF